MRDVISHAMVSPAGSVAFHPYGVTLNAPETGLRGVIGFKKNIELVVTALPINAAFGIGTYYQVADHAQILARTMIGYSDYDTPKCPDLQGTVSAGFRIVPSLKKDKKGESVPAVFVETAGGVNTDFKGSFAPTFTLSAGMFVY